MAKSSKPLSGGGNTTEDPAVLAAIAYADKKAGDDDRAFMRVLEERVAATTGRGTQLDAGNRTRAVIPIRRAPLPTSSFRIREDPRYLANVRALARRTGGNLRVIGGAEVRKGEFLDCVAVGSDAQWACTGTLIGSNVVVTAGHCAKFATRVFFGSDVDKAGKIVRVKKRFPHPQYGKGKHNDLMVLLLADKVETVAPRKIAPKATIDKSTDGRVIGFGHSDPGGTFGYGVKRFVDVPIATPDCRGTVDGKDDKVTYGCDAGLEIVAGRPLLEQDSCRGDSGGPFYVLDNQDRWLLAGATSRATDSAVHTCGDGGIYVRLDRYRSWITSLDGVALS